MALLIILFISVIPSKVHFDQLDQIIIWNVGQGQWTTVIQKNSCIHFDVGGEFLNIIKIKQACNRRNNFIYYSHWDWDHIGLSNQLKNSVHKICISRNPIGKTKNYKKDFLSRIPNCNKNLKGIREIPFKIQNPKNDNELSRIFIFDQKLLIPGDSTKKIERIWAKNLKKSIRWLVVGHHGSNTSTHEILLSKLSMTQQAFVSARKSVYGHPHPKVLGRLKKKGISTLKTEDWGNIRIILRMN